MKCQRQGGEGPLKLPAKFVVGRQCRQGSQSEGSEQTIATVGKTDTMLRTHPTDLREPIKTVLFRNQIVATVMSESGKRSTYFALMIPVMDQDRSNPARLVGEFNVSACDSSETGPIPAVVEGYLAGGESVSVGIIGAGVARRTDAKRILKLPLPEPRVCRARWSGFGEYVDCLVAHPTC